MKNSSLVTIVTQQDVEKFRINLGDFEKIEAVSHGIPLDSFSTPSYKLFLSNQKRNRKLQESMVKTVQRYDASLAVVLSQTDVSNTFSEERSYSFGLYREK